MAFMRNFERNILHRRLGYGIEEGNTGAVGRCLFAGLCGDNASHGAQMVLNWVNKADWSALMDVVPSTFSALSGYVVIMLLANALLIGMARHKN